MPVYLYCFSAFKNTMSIGHQNALGNESLMEQRNSRNMNKGEHHEGNHCRNRLHDCRPGYSRDVNHVENVRDAVRQQGWTALADIVLVAVHEGRKEVVPVEILPQKPEAEVKNGGDGHEIQRREQRVARLSRFVLRPPGEEAQSRLKDEHHREQVELGRKFPRPVDVEGEADVGRALEARLGDDDADPA